MRKPILLLFFGIICASCISQKPEKEVRDPARPYVSVELDELPLEWKDISQIIQSFAEAGYVDVDISDFKWRYYCIIPEQTGHDELLMSNQDISSDKIKLWCQRNKGKYASVSFGEKVDFSTIKKVGSILDAKGIKFSTLREYKDDATGVRIDIDRRN